MLSSEILILSDGVLGSGFRIVKSSSVDATAGQITMLLRELRYGNKAATERLIPLVYPDLKRLAEHYMRRERQGHSLQPTALVNEAYLRLIGGAGVEWQDRAHFFGVAPQLMRRILVDHARGRQAGKRGGPGQHQVTLDGALCYNYRDPDELLAVNEALERLAAFDPRQARIVELRFFVGLSVEEVAEVLGFSSRTIKREWDMARAWLRGQLGDAPEA
jgi:RNA polymerase sigma factor (TIGR02999 family)